jgi:hypothetical protein
MGLPTRADYFNLGAEEVISRSLARPPAQRISRDAIFTEGSDINLILASASAMADEVTRNLALRCGALYLDSAEGSDLDRLVNDRFGDQVERKQPAPALALLTFTRPNPAGGQVTLSIGTKVRTIRGTEFALTQVLTIPAGSTAPVTVQGQAVVVGTAGNVAAGTITQFVQQPADPDLQVNNEVPATGGADVESDASLRERARDFYRTARRGTLAAIEFGALTVAGVRSASALESVDSNGNPTGIVQLFIADANGQANQALATAVQLALVEFRCAGIFVSVVGATPRFEDIRYRLRFESGVDTAAAFEELRFLTVVAVNSLPPNAILPTSLLLEQARRVPGIIVLEDTMVEPVGDVVPNLGEILKTSADLVSAEFG